MNEQDQDTSAARTYRGRSLDEIVPLIRRELGDDAVIVARRTTTSGGLAGFFARRAIEVDVVGPGARADLPFARQLQEAHDEQSGDDRDGRYERRAPAAPPHRPVVSPEVDALPVATDVTVDQLFPPAPRAHANGLAALFSAGTEQPPGREPQPPADAEAPRAREPHPPADAEAPPAREPQPLPRPSLRPAAESVTSVALPLAARGVAERLIARGLRADLAEAVAEEGVSGLLPLAPDTDPATVVVQALARRIPVLPLRRGGGVLGFVGPGGAGKTLTTARLAAAHARHGSLPVTVVALRSPDGGAELTRLLAPYGVALHAVESGAEGVARIADLRDGLVIVDTPAVSPRAQTQLRELAGELRELAPDELHLAVPATMGPDAARELVRGVRELGVAALVVTHADETEQLGTAVGLAIETGLPLSYLACGQGVETGLRVASPDDLAAALAP